MTMNKHVFSRVLLRNYKKQSTKALIKALMSNAALDIHAAPGENSIPC